MVECQLPKLDVVGPNPIARFLHHHSFQWLARYGKCKDKKNHIDSYQFGEIVVDGISYSSDIIILGNSVQSNWWRKQGHLLSAEDVQPIIAARPTVLIVGCGASKLMKVSDQARQVLQEHDIQLEALDTYKAVQRFNELSQAGVNVTAALHLTC